MDYVVEKATELGVGRIIPVVSERTIPRWKDAKKEALKERWRKIAVEASKQCGRSDIPVIDDIVEFADCIAKIGTCPLRLIAALSDEAIPLKDTLRDFKGDGIAVAIGPEGDFTPEEIEVAKSGGFKLISLGPRVLKSDTAGLSVLAAINYEYSD
jgi:16S rRNA (uracil1498-N3)-methyltransferase